MKLCYWLTLCLSCAPALCSAADEPTNFRVGVGSWQLSIDPGQPDSDDRGIALMAEFPQSEHAGSRFLYYRQQGEQGYWLHGVETQLFWGWGLNQPGWRLFSGPSWYWQKSHSDQQSHQVHNGWGWHLGTGWQWQALILDVSASYRLPDEYRVNGKTPDVTTTNLMLSYRF